MYERLMSADFSSIDTWDKITSFVGFVITVITLFITNSARKAIRSVQENFTFDRRIPNHLKELNTMLSEYNNLMNNVTTNINEINNLLGNISSEINSLKSKIKDKNIKVMIKEAQKQIEIIRETTYVPTQNQSLIAKFKKAFSGQNPSVPDTIQMNYIKLGEIYNAVNNIRKDAKTRLTK